MPQLIPQYAFVAGEVSPEFLGRTDLVKYGLGLSVALNFTIGYRGGAYSRAGSRFVGPVANDDQATKIVRFKATDDDYLLVLTHQQLRVVRNGGYILHPEQAITGITAADPAVVTVPTHGYTTGGWVYITESEGLTEVNGRYFQIGATTTNTYELLNIDGTNFDSSALGAWTAGGQSARVYTISTTWNADDLAGLRWEQEFNDVTFTHLSRPPRKLTFVSNTNWVLADIDFGSDVAAPENVSLTPSSAATAGVAFAITAIVDGVESLPSAYEITTLTVDYTATAGSMKVEWDAVEEASEYFIYRSLLLPTGADISLAQEVGFLGRALAPQFIDNNIIPNFTKTPPINENPFANSKIQAIEMTAAGTGYAQSDTVTMSGGGTGFEGYPVVNAAGEIIGVNIVNGGEDYVSPAITFVTSGGSGATATVTVGPASGNYPREYKKFQQRGVYAGSTNFPMTIWGSKPGVPDNFDVSAQLNDGDSYSFRVDATVVKPILHLVSLKSGLLVFDEGSVNQFRAPEGTAVTPLNALAEPQLYNGIGAAKPLTVGLDVLYAQNLGSGLNVMAYTEYTNSFTLQNLSSLSHHLLGPNKEAVRLEYSEEPDKLVYGLREDGVLLTMTYDRLEEVFGWARHETQGTYDDIAVAKEESGWTLYTVVRRYINGAWVKFIERSLPRATDLLEDHWGVDCGLEYEHETPAATLSAAAASGDGVVFSASAAVFTAGDVGKVIYTGGGKAEIATFNSTTEVLCDIVRDITDVLPQRAVALPVDKLTGEWTMADPVTTISGLWHLEGETVSYLTDGDAFIDGVVTNGALSWDTPATKIRIGLGYNCDGKTLPPVSTRTLLQSRRIDTLGVGVQLNNTRGLSFGVDFDNLVEMKDRTDEDWGEQIAGRSDSSYVPLDGAWDEDGTICFRQAYPLPANVLSLVFDIDEGDEGYS